STSKNSAGEQRPDEPESGKSSGSKFLTLPSDGDYSGLEEIIKKGEKVSAPQKDKYKDREFETVVDDEWLKALEKEELLAECERTGLNEEELKEYKGWLDLLGEDLIDSMIEIAKGLVLPAEDVEKFYALYTGILKKPIKGILGGKPFIKRKETKPTPVKITLLIDRSGSMSGDRILYAKLTMMLLLLVLFAVNEELEKNRWPLIEFEIGSYNADSDLFISHETSTELGEDRKERLIYDAMKRLEASGWTDDKKSLGEFVTRLKESPEVAGAEEETKRILFSICDGNVNTSEKEGIRGVLAYGLENYIEVFGVSVGDEEAMQTVLNAFGEERAILPENP
ncbi:MAG: hypothetical protein KAJ14_10505, partial [Candidatus Omnitrophica bacterium]|nr:hypothetical protein [Candidatus Omnitrophota bacterium]